MTKSKKQKNIKVYLYIAGLWLIIFALLISLYLFRPLFTGRCVDGFVKDGESWECNYPLFLNNRSVRQVLENLYRNKCSKNLGKFDVYPVLPSGGWTFTCAVPFSDKGDPCKNSDDCRGNCEYIGNFPDSCTEVEEGIYTCSESIIGTCSEFKKYFYTEVVDGELHIHKSHLRFLPLIP